ncbi:predicted protein [Chaetomium globosum CBS 148.51]|uniref:Uncharacterized protein n=1 Tax=Chaetomium globosum (strain ATCC 6205 / CBS 148.51 / DSM 1962 / NBRC 6347 / NRRL 1970) TaxID=306901 RepID=Q2GZN8_CHAGB|nr:uncharacterized protein CHGG_05008 [Chaetomium globosum CBS 148.51]EAQ88389.1 predicted protein [Chaetomium globosum CBS 148.51]
MLEAPVPLARSPWRDTGFSFCCVMEKDCAVDSAEHWGGVRLCMKPKSSVAAEVTSFQAQVETNAKIVSVCLNLCSCGASVSGKLLTSCQFRHGETEKRETHDPEPHPAEARVTALSPFPTDHLHGCHTSAPTSLASLILYHSLLSAETLQVPGAQRKIESLKPRCFNPLMVGINDDDAA